MNDRQLLLRFENAMHHGSGYGIAGLVDRPFLCDGLKMPYLSGAAIKGRFRWAALRIMKTQEHERLCSQEPGGFCRRESCLLCRIFGSPWRPGAVVFGEAYPISQQRSLLAMAISDRRTAGTMVRATTGIERQRRVVKKDHLFTTEVAPALTFESSVEGHLEDDEWKLLEQCALILTHFGADSSRGLGSCRFEFSTREAKE